MTTAAHVMDDGRDYPVAVHVEPALADRNRLTTFFRLLLAIPHMLLVGGPIAAVFAWGWNHDGPNFNWGGSGLLGIVAFVAAIIAWFAIVFTGRHPNGLWDLAVYYLRWRARATAYLTLLRDEYPPFGDADYPAALTLSRPDGERDRLTVGFRLILALPQLIVVALLNCVWAITTVVAWWAILILGRFPAPLYTFGVGMLRWNMRVEAYLLLLRDEYPPFSLE